MKRNWLQIGEINEQGDIVTDTTEIQRIIRNYEKLYTNKFDNLEEMDKSLDTYALSKLSHEEIENLNRLISYNKIEPSVKKKKKQAQDQMAPLLRSTKHLKD